MTELVDRELMHAANDRTDVGVAVAEVLIRRLGQREFIRLVQYSLRLGNPIAAEALREILKRQDL